NSQVLSFCSFPLASTMTRLPAGDSLSSAATATPSAASSPALQTAAHFIQDFIAGLPLDAGVGTSPASSELHPPRSRRKSGRCETVGLLALRRAIRHNRLVVVRFFKDPLNGDPGSTRW